MDIKETVINEKEKLNTITFDNCEKLSFLMSTSVTREIGMPAVIIT